MLNKELVCAGHRVLHMSHPIHWRLLAERLLGLRRSTEGRRYASAQRSGRVDAAKLATVSPRFVAGARERIPGL